MQPQASNASCVSLTVRHRQRKIIVCFIYKSRQRFAVIGQFIGG